MAEAFPSLLEEVLCEARALPRTAASPNQQKTIDRIIVLLYPIFTQGEIDGSVCSIEYGGRGNFPFRRLFARRQPRRLASALRALPQRAIGSGPTRSADAARSPR